MATKTRAELKNDAESKAQALDIIKKAAANPSKVVSDAGKKVLAAIEAGTLSEEAILSLSSGTWEERIDFRNGKWDRFRHYDGSIARVAKRKEAELPAFKCLISALTAQFEAGGLKEVSLLMHQISSHLTKCALHGETDAHVKQIFDYNIVGWERAAKAAQKKEQHALIRAQGAKEVDALLNPKAKKPAKKPAKKAA